MSVIRNDIDLTLLKEKVEREFRYLDLKNICGMRYRMPYYEYSKIRDYYINEVRKMIPDCLVGDRKRAMEQGFPNGVFVRDLVIDASSHSSSHNYTVQSKGHSDIIMILNLTVDNASYRYIIQIEKDKEKYAVIAKELRKKMEV